MLKTNYFPKPESIVGRMTIYSHSNTHLRWICGYFKGPGWQGVLQKCAEAKRWLKFHEIPNLNFGTINGWKTIILYRMLALYVCEPKNMSNLQNLIFGILPTIEN